MKRLFIAALLVINLGTNWLPGGIVTLPHRWATKPPQGAQVNWGHPLAAGLVEVVLYNEGNGPVFSLVQRNNASPQGIGSGPTWSTGDHGLRRTYAAASTQHDDFGVIPALKITGALTIHVGFVCTTGNDSTEHSLVTKRPNSIGSDFEYALAIYNDGTNGPYFQSHVSGAFSTIEPTGVFVTQNAFQTLSATRTPAGTSGTLYLNGISVKTGSMSQPGASATNLSIGATNDASLPFSGSIYFVYLWNRQLSASDIKWINTDPYAFIAPPMPHSYQFFSQLPQVYGKGEVR